MIVESAEYRRQRSEMSMKPTPRDSGNISLKFDCGESQVEEVPSVRLRGLGTLLRK